MAKTSQWQPPAFCFWVKLRSAPSTRCRDLGSPHSRARLACPDLRTSSSSAPTSCVIALSTTSEHISACLEIFIYAFSLSSSGPSSFVLAASSNKQTQNVMNNFIYYAIFYKSVGMSALIVGATGALMTALVPVSKMPLKSFKSLYQSAGRSKSAM